ncbi:MAG: sigma-54 dependent transcriptional regulator [Vicinamibacterales bacterium]
MPRRPIDTTAAALLLTDAATIVGAGHSIELLAHRAASLLEDTISEAQLDISSESGCEYQATPSSSSEVGADGSVELELRGSDRRVTIRVRQLRDLDEIAVVKSVADLAQMAVHRAAGTEQEDDETLWPRTLLPSDEGDTVFRSPRMAELLTIAMRLAATDLPVLLTGETGTGKEVFARLIHEHSRVKRGPFMPFNCSSVPKDLAESQLFGHRRGAFTGANDSYLGVVRAAERGTLFLDEVGDLELMTQPKLLRFLESGEIHPVGELRPLQVAVRIVAATNADLEELIAQGRFRADLFYRLGVARLTLPPLRERKDEIPAFASMFLSRFSRECHRKGLRLGDDFVAALLLYDWPGNIRELANEIRRAVAMASDTDTLTSAALTGAIADRWNARTPAPIAKPSSGVHISLDLTLPQAVSELEERFIQHALAATGGRVTEAAQLLGLSRKGLFLKRRRRGLRDAADEESIG